MGNTIIYNKREYKLTRLSDEELHELRMSLVESLKEVREQLFEIGDYARNHNIFSDPDWFDRTVKVQQVYEQSFYKVQRQLFNNSARRQRARTVAEIFIELAEEVLDSEEFVMLIVQAKEYATDEQEASLLPSE